MTDEAAKTYRHVLQRDRHASGAHYGLAFILLRSGLTEEAIGHLEKNHEGRMAMTRVELRPSITFAQGAAPSSEELAGLHEKAHKYCFIANSVRTEVTVAS